MKILKSLYIIWMIFWGFGAILGYYMGYDATFTKTFFFLVILYLFPLLPYLHYLIFEKTKNKNIFISICYYLLLFVITAYYFTLIYSCGTNFLTFFIMITLYMIICSAIILWKFKINLRLYFYIILCIFTYLYIVLHIFIACYEIEWTDILLDKDVRIYIYKEIINLLTEQ